MLNYWRAAQDRMDGKGRQIALDIEGLAFAIEAEKRRDTNDYDATFVDHLSRFLPDRCYLWRFQEQVECYDQPSPHMVMFRRGFGPWYRIRS